MQNKKHMIGTLFYFLMNFNLLLFQSSY